jgi:hypothetical protein
MREERLSFLGGIKIDSANTCNQGKTEMLLATWERLCMEGKRSCRRLF